MDFIYICYLKCLVAAAIIESELLEGNFRIGMGDPHDVYVYIYVSDPHG